MTAPALLRTAFTPPATDADLLARFVRSRDEPAFAELVRRHGPAVYRVCRRLVGPADADDAFQATFLVLATRAAAVRKATSVGSWLIGVAGRVASQMRKARLRRERHELASGGPRRSDPPDVHDLGRVLDEELVRLPDHLRAPVVVCLLGGRTQEQAVAELGGSIRTIRRRLDEAKQLLRLRLERRGVVPAVTAGLAAGVGEVSAGMPHDLGRRAVGTVFDFLAGGADAAPPVVIAKGVAMGALVRKVKLVMATVAVGLTGLGVGLADGPAEPKPDPGVVPPVAAPTDPGDRIPPLNLPPAANPAAVPPPLPAPSRPVTGVTIRTANFKVTAPTPEVAWAVGEAAEKHRTALALEWLGRELPAWKEPCPVTVTVNLGGSGGATTFTFDDAGKPAVRSMEMTLSGDLKQILTSSLPHEVMHTVLATHFGKPLPRWADEGIAVLAESVAERHTHEVRCREVLNQGRGIPLRVLFTLTEYPKDMIVLFAQGHSVCRFLLTRPLSPALTMFDLVKTPPPHPDVQARRGLLVFLTNATGDLGWDKAAEAVYGFESVDALQEAWVAWLRQPPPAPPTSPPPAAGTLTAAPAVTHLPPEVHEYPKVGGRASSPRSFAVVGQSPAVARALANELSVQRRVQSIKWVGGRVPDAPPRPVRVEYEPDGKADSYLNVETAEDKFYPALVHLRGTLTDVLDGDIPQLMVRAVFAESSGRDVPGWAVTGLPAIEAPAAKQRLLDAAVRKLVADGQAVKLSAFFAHAVSHQPDTKAQGHSVVRFLLTRPVPADANVTFPAVEDGGKPVIVTLSGPHHPYWAVTAFVRRGLKDGWDAAAKEVYGFAGVDDLEAKWIEWLKTPGSKVPDVSQPPPAPQTPRIPPVKLSADDPKPAAADITPVSSRNLKLAIDYKPGRRQSVDLIQLFVSRDGGKTWAVADTVTPDKDHFTYTAPEDGVYWLNMVLWFEDGRKDPADGTRVPPAQKVLVDTAPPVLRLKPAGPGAVEWEAEDAHLDPNGIEVGVRWKGETKWNPITPRPFAARDRYTWDDVPADKTLEVRVTARDRAGNEAIAVAEVRGR